MRTPSLPALPSAGPFKHPQNALKPASQAVFDPFLVPFPLTHSNAPQTALKRPSNPHQ
nr:MAG TPA: hypothetical protein [Caudoviricetes sp.]